MTDFNSRPLELLGLMQGLSALTKKHGIVIGGAPVLTFEREPQGMYCLNLNNDGPEFGWQPAAAVLQPLMQQPHPHPNPPPEGEGTDGLRNLTKEI